MRLNGGGVSVWRNWTLPGLYGIFFTDGQIGICTSVKNMDLGGKEMKFDIVYAVMCEDQVEYASTAKEYAEEYADSQRYKARQEVLDEWGNDDPTEENIAEADFQAGFDGNYYEVVKINLSGKTEDDVVELPDGDEVEVSDILEKLRTSE
jgi:hypothetical protein